MSEKVFVNYVYDSCYSLAYGDYFLIFDYAEGILEIPESKHIMFFVSDKDRKSYTNEIFNLENLNSVKYVLNKNISNLKYQDNIIFLNNDELGMRNLKKLYKKDNVYLLGGGEAIKIKSNTGEIFIRTISLDCEKIGFLIEIESLVIFFGGTVDFSKINDDVYLDLLDELEFKNPDMIFLPITDLDKKSFAYLDKLINDSDSQILFPTKIGDREEESIEFKKFYKTKNTDIRTIKKANYKIEIEINCD